MQFYMFSREIDNNPFIVFQMHGFDLLKELKKRGIEVDNVRQEVEVPALKDLVTTLPAKDSLLLHPKAISRKDMWRNCAV